jgi:hypothetical protein
MRRHAASEAGTRRREFPHVRPNATVGAGPLLSISLEFDNSPRLPGD